MPDDQVQFKSPKTGKVQVVPPENWEDALGMGYQPISHKVMYSPDGKRGMVPNSDLSDYVKQGYQTTPKTQFESSVTGEGATTKGAGGAAFQTVKGMIPSAPGTTVNPFNPQFWTKENLIGNPSMDISKGTLAQGGREAATEYQRARAAGTNPLAAGYSAAISGAGPLVGVSDLEQQALAAKGEGGQILGQSAVPAALALSPMASEGIKAAGVPGKVATALRTEGGTGAIKPGVHTVSRLAGAGLGHLAGVPGLGELGGYSVGPGLAEMIIPKKGLPVPPPEFPGASLPSADEFYANRGAELEAIRKLQTKGAGRKGGMTTPPAPFGTGMTSSADVTAGAPVPQGSPTPFQPISQGNLTKTAPYTEVPGITAPKVSIPPSVTEPSPSAPTSVLSRAKTPIELGVEPDMNNPAHVKMINDIIGQGLNEAAVSKLKVRAKLGDRFAAVALDYWRSKTGR